VPSVRPNKNSRLGIRTWLAASVRTASHFWKQQRSGWWLRNSVTLPTRSFFSIPSGAHEFLLRARLNLKPIQGTRQIHVILYAKGARHGATAPADALPIEDILTVKHDVIPLDGADVFQQGEIDSIGASGSHSLAGTCRAARNLPRLGWRRALVGRGKPLTVSYRDQKLYFIAKSQATGGAPAKSEGLTRVSSRGT